MSDGVYSNTGNLYIPKSALGSLLGKDSFTREITRTGNTLVWAPDDSSTTGKVALFYTTSAQDMMGSNAVLSIDHDVLVIDDNGHFNLDGLISAKAKFISFILVRGNTLSLTGNGKKILLHFGSMDHHYYRITN